MKACYLQFPNFCKNKMRINNYKSLQSPKPEDYLKLLPLVNFRNRLNITNNRLISINQVDNLNTTGPWWFDKCVN